MINTSIKVLLVEDDLSDAQLLQEILQESSASFVIAHAHRLSGGLAHLEQGGVDVILLDLSLPDSQGIETFSAIHAQAPGVPILILAGLDDETLAVKAMQSGAQDYLLKGRMDKHALGRAIRYAIARKQTEEHLIQPEERLRVSQERFRALIENSPDAIALFSAEGAILYGSPATTRVLGYTIDEFVGRNAFELIHPDDHACVLGRLAESLQKPAVGVDIAAHVRHKDGSWRFLEGIFTNLLDDPNVRAIVNNYRDSTERKRAEEALRTSKAQIEAILRGVSDGVSVQDRTGRLVYANDVAAQMSGYASARAFLEAPLAEAIQQFDILDEAGQPFPLERLPGRPALQGLPSSEALVRFRVRATGEERWSVVRATPIYDESGQPQLAINTIQDITAHKRAEEELRASQQHFRELTESLPQLVWTCQLDGPCDYLSPQWVEYTGVPAAEQLGFGWLEQLHPDDREPTIAMWNRTVAAEAIFDTEFRIRRYDGVYRWFKTRAVPLRDAGGQIVKWFGSNTDIHEAREMREALSKQAARLTVLADASRAFAEASLDSQALLDLLVRKIAEALGEMCIVRLLSDDREWLNVARIPAWASKPKTRPSCFRSSGGSTRLTRAAARAPGWGCASRGSSRTCWAARSSSPAHLGRAAASPCCYRRHDNIKLQG